jgi:hypothetical protein
MTMKTAKQYAEALRLALATGSDTVVADTFKAAAHELTPPEVQALYRHLDAAGIKGKVRDAIARTTAVWFNAN